MNSIVKSNHATLHHVFIPVHSLWPNLYNKLTFFPLHCTNIPTNTGKAGFGCLRLKKLPTQWVSTALPAASFFKGQTHLTSYFQKSSFQKRNTRNTRNTRNPRKHAKRLIEAGQTRSYHHHQNVSYQNMSYQKLVLWPSLRVITAAIIVQEMFLILLEPQGQSWWGAVEWEETGLLKIWLKNQSIVWGSAEILHIILLCLLFYAFPTFLPFLYILCEECCKDCTRAIHY